MIKITDREYTTWHPMGSLAQNANYWIYFSPDNQQAALVNTMNKQIIFISDRKSGEEIYKAPNSQKHAQFFYAMKQASFQRPDRVV